MPKMKSNKAAKKRLRVTGTGRIRRGKAGLSHMMRGKSANRRRNLRKNGMVDDSDKGRVRSMLPYDL
jgi:large subunit ribosomal protein L35